MSKKRKKSKVKSTRNKCTIAMGKIEKAVKKGKAIKVTTLCKKYSLPANCAEELYFMAMFYSMPSDSPLTSVPYPR